MRIRGAKFKFSVDHGKFNFPPLYAEIESSGRNPIVSFAIATIIFFEEILFIFRPLREKMASRKTEVRGLVGRPMLSTEYALFLSSSLRRLELSFWVAGLGIATNSCKKTTCFHKRAIVELIVKYERYLLKHAQMLPVYAYVVKFQDNDRDSSFIGSLEAPIIID